MEQSRIVVGVDEAGYGPNIGPMIVAATAWRIPAKMSEAELCKTLKKHFRPEAWTEDCQHVPLGDSKKLYQPQVGLKTLECGLLAMISQLGIEANCFRQLIERVCNLSPESDLSSLFAAWHLPLEGELPLAISAEDLATCTQRAREKLANNDITLVGIQARVITESAFNQAIASLGSKGRLLSNVTMELVVQFLSEFADEPVEVFCDRQGGRKKYCGVLLDAMPDEWFDVLQELDDRSSYRRMRQPECRVHFSVSGDSFPPTALASMTAKYLRERFMGIINRYWQQHVVDLKPTAGYPVDAKRFREAIEARAIALGHATEQWWRVC